MENVANEKRAIRCRTPSKVVRINAHIEVMWELIEVNLVHDQNSFPHRTYAIVQQNI